MAIPAICSTDYNLRSSAWRQDLVFTLPEFGFALVGLFYPKFSLLKSECLLLKSECTSMCYCASEV